MIHIHKFGGASVKDAPALANVLQILEKLGEGQKLVVVSAMGKTTNRMEAILEAWLENRSEDCQAAIQELADFHFGLVKELDIPEGEQQLIGEEVERLILKIIAITAAPSEHSYARAYDELVGFGEYLSTGIIYGYLMAKGMAVTLLDAREYVRSNSRHRNATVDWDETKGRIEKLFDDGTSLYLTQGFIGSDSDDAPTTLGREGSDYTASIFATCLNAKSVSVWKDVPGVMNADPRKFVEVEQFNKLSYEEAISLTYYGASVIHPKTVRPLQKSGIPLIVRSFVDFDNEGTSIANQEVEPAMSSKIQKNKIALLRFNDTSLSFIDNTQLAYIFNRLKFYGLPIHLMQNNPNHLVICTDDDERTIAKLKNKLEENLSLSSAGDLSLLNIRHASADELEDALNLKNILIQQRTEDTLQLVYKNTDQS